MERDTLKIWDVKNESRLSSNRLFRVLIHDYAHWLPRSHVLVSRWILYHCIERRLFFISWSQCVRKALFSWWTQSRAKCYTKPMWSIPLYFVCFSADCRSATTYLWSKTRAMMCFSLRRMVLHRVCFDFSDQQRAAVPIQSYDPSQGFVNSNLVIRFTHASHCRFRLAMANVCRWTSIGHRSNCALRRRTNSAMRWICSAAASLQGFDARRNDDFLALQNGSEAGPFYFTVQIHCYKWW